MCVVVAFTPAYACVCCNAITSAVWQVHRDAVAPVTLVVTLLNAVHIATIAALASQQQPYNFTVTPLES
jgi:hypothetical protein